MDFAKSCLGMRILLFILFSIQIEATKFSSCSLDDNWDTFRCANINPVVDDKTIILSATGGAQWPGDLHCLGIRNNLKLSGAFKMSTELITVAPRVGQRGIGLMFNAVDEDNYDFAMLRYMREDCTQIDYGYVERGILMVNPPKSFPCQALSGNDWHEFQILVDESKTVRAFIDGKVSGSFEAHFTSRGFGGVVAANGFDTVAEFRNFDIAPIIQNSCGCCPFPYTKIAGLCIYVSPEHEKKNYADAKDYCKSINGRLYEPRNRDQYEALASYLENVFEFELPRNDYTWLGINDIASEGNFVYESSNEVPIFTTWDTSVPQPDNAGGGEDCVEMFYLSAIGWNDRPCSWRNRFLCEISGL